jgi:multicomponent Na+:H+ antiporter subunit D
VAALIFSSLVNAVLFYRVFEVAFSRPEKSATESPSARSLEAPAMMIPSLVLVSVALLAIGLSAGPLVREVIRLAAPVL